MSRYSIATSSELMENYVQADVLAPQRKFAALQTDRGASLLFAIGTGDMFNLIMELPGDRGGWRRADLSARQIEKDFPGGATCKTFGAGQTARPKPGAASEIHLAMALSDGVADHLYLSLGNSDADLGWASNPVWIPAPYNARDAVGAPIPPPSPFQIAGVMIATKKYIVVDVLGSMAESVQTLWRFYIDTTDPKQPLWQRRPLPEGFENVGYQSCLGQAATRAKKKVDGIYTRGSIAGVQRLIYTPVYNAYGPGPPAPRQLAVPGGLVVQAIAASRNPDQTTDLYAISGDNLYYFASDNQQYHEDGPAGEGAFLLASPLFSGVRALFASAARDEDQGTDYVTVWGLNGGDQVFYLTCREDGVGDPRQWSAPIAIMSGVDAISPYLDRQYGANTFFAHDAQGLIKAIKSPTTGLWTRQRIALPANDPLSRAATPISSYTTHITVTDENGRQAANVPVSLSAASPTSVTINHLYYIVGPTPIVISTDELGAIAIVEPARTLAAARFTVSVEGQSHPRINPMDAPFQRNNQYDSVDALRSAAIVDRHGAARPFVPAGVSDAVLQSVAQSNASLARAYASFAALPAPRGSRPPTIAFASAAPPAALVAAGFGGAIATDLGDLFSWLESGVEAAITIVEDAASSVWHFVAEIAGKIYRGVLDCVEKVVDAVTWVYNAINVALEDVLKFLEYAFEWKDILVTHRVLKNVFIQLSHFAIAEIKSLEQQLKLLFDKARAEVAALSHVDWNAVPGLGQTPGQITRAALPLPAQNSAPARLGLHHFQGNLEASATSYLPPGVDDKVLQIFLKAVQNELQTLKKAGDVVKTQIIDPFETLTNGEIVRRFLGIVAEVGLDSSETVLDALLELAAELATEALEALTARIDFPVLSWLYKELTGEDLSIMDLACLIAAIPVTIIYKAEGEAYNRPGAPFRIGDRLTDGLLAATNFAELTALFVAPQPRAAGSVSARAELDEEALKTMTFVLSICAFFGTEGLLLTSNFARFKLDASGAEKQKQLIKLDALGAFFNILYVSPNFPNIVQFGDNDAWYGVLNGVFAIISILKGFAIVITRYQGSNNSDNTAFAGVETALNTVWNVPVIYNEYVNFVYLKTTYKSIIDETFANLCFNVGGMLELAIDRTPKEEQPELYELLVAAQDAMMLIYGGEGMYAASIYKFEPDQHH